MWFLLFIKEYTQGSIYFVVFILRIRIAPIPPWLIYLQRGNRVIVKLAFNMFKHSWRISVNLMIRRQHNDPKEHTLSIKCIILRIISQKVDKPKRRRIFKVLYKSFQQPHFKYAFCCPEEIHAPCNIWGYHVLWPFRLVAVLACGRFGLWPFRFVAVSVCGCSSLWSFRFLAFSVVAVSVCRRYDLLP